MYFKAKKRLGQNFLIDANIQAKIIAACQLEVDESVLEIGPGKGALTRLLCQKVARVVAVEIDKDLCAMLTQDFATFKNLQVVNQDILKFDLGFFLLRKVPLKCFTVIGNIPYYISTPVLQRLLRYRTYIKRAFLTVQKEFARRIVATPGSKEYGSLSCYIQYYTFPRILFTLGRRCFSPAPSVDSSFLKLEFKETLPLGSNDERMLFKIIRNAFSQRRKKLHNSLEGIVPKEALHEFFQLRTIDPGARAETLHLNDFIALAKFLKKKIKKT